jgi:hypothetical protein
MNRLLIISMIELIAKIAFMLRYIQHEHSDSSFALILSNYWSKMITNSIAKYLRK